MVFLKSLEYRVLPIPFYVLTLWGLWCPENVKLQFQRVYFIFTFIVVFSEMLLTLEVFIYIIIIIYMKEFELEIIFIILSMINGLYKALSILLIRERITKLLLMGFEDRWRIPRDDAEKKILTNDFSENLRVHFFYALACVAGVFIRLMGPIIKPQAREMLPVSAWYPYDTKKPLNFWLTYCQIMFVGASTISMHIGADTMLSGFMLQSCTQIKLLKHRLRNFFKTCRSMNGHSCCPSAKVENELIKQYICDHQLLYTYAETLNNNLLGWMIAVLIVVVPNICINVYFLSFAEIGMNIDFITSFGLFSISWFQIFLPCWYGNEVMIQSIEIRKAAYDINWMNVTPNVRKALIIIMLRTSRPIQLTVANIIPINIHSFLKIIKTSYSVLSILQQMRLVQNKI